MVLIKITIVLSLLLFLVLLCSVTTSTAGVDDGIYEYYNQTFGGNGTPGNPYPIMNCSDLQAMEDNLSSHYALADNINCSETRTWDGGQGFDPVGDDADTPFTDSLNGNGVNITDLVINRTAESWVGLFGYTGPSSDITDIGLIHANVLRANYVGALFGDNDSTINNSYATGNVSGTGEIGALFGGGNGTFGQQGGGFGILGNGLFGGGNGTPSNPYMITDCLDLQAMNNSLTSHYVLNRSINCSETRTWNEGAGFDPVGCYPGYSCGDRAQEAFTGTFDGNNHTISGLFINRTSEDFVGLFGLTSSGSSITDVGLENVSVTGYREVGGLVGVNWQGSISNSYSTGNVSGTSWVGGLVGDSGGNISDSYSTGNVSGNYSVGGLAGYNVGTISDSYSTGNISGNYSVGGLVGENYGGDISNSYYPYNSTRINGQNAITIGAIYQWQFDEWLANGQSLDVIEYMDYNSGYYMIDDPSDFKQLLAFGYNSSLKFNLTSDIDLEEGFYIPLLNAEFNGNGFNMTGLSVNLSFAAYLGLFGYVGDSGSIQDIGVVNASVLGSNNAGGLVGLNYGGSISNSYATGTVSGNDLYVGGLAGYNRGDISNSSSTVNVSGTSRVGGLVGVSEGTISNSYSTSNVSGDYWVGGLAGWNRGDISNSYSTGAVSGTDYDVGGLVGVSEGTISNSYATGNVSGSGYRVGGLAGWNDGTISDSYATGAVSGTDYDVGGLVGENYHGTINNSYATGNVSGTSRVGGLVGENYATINNSYSTGSVSGNYSVGGLVGYSYANISNSYTTGNVSGYDHVGGLVGWNVGTISNSYATGNVSGYDYVGGLIGWNDGNISNSYSTGAVSGTHYDVGGLIGVNVGTISNSYATGNVSGTSNLGGLIGVNSHGTISNSYSTGNVSGNYSVGGLSGVNNGGNISNSYATGNVSGTSTVGGLSGVNNGGNISNSYATGNVSGYDYVGGLVGYNYNYATISNSYSTGNVSGTSTVGGLVGYNDGNISNSYWFYTPGDPTDCYSNSPYNTGCTKVNSSVSYFYNVDNPPMDIWSFPPWDDAQDYVCYPHLAWESYSCAGRLRITISIINSSSVRLVWSAVSGATYKIYNSSNVTQITDLDPENPGLDVEIITTSSTSWTDSGISGLRERYYRVSAVGAVEVLSEETVGLFGIGLAQTG